jgi:hypothetical protein
MNEPIKSEQNEQDELLSTILSKLGSSKPSEDSRGNADLSSLLSGLISSQDIISSLPNIIAIAKPIIESLSKSQSTESDTRPQVTATAHPAAAARAKSDSDRAALLCAMKPYLSRDRQNAIDYIIKLSRLGDILKTL